MNPVHAATAVKRRHDRSDSAWLAALEAGLVPQAVPILDADLAIGDDDLDGIDDFLQVAERGRDDR